MIKNMRQVKFLIYILPLIFSISCRNDDSSEPEDNNCEEATNDFEDIVTVIWPDIYDETFDINQGRPLIPHDEDGTVHDLTYYVPAGQFKIYFQLNYDDLIPNIGEKDIPVEFDSEGYFRDIAHIDMGNFTTYWVIPDWNGGNVHFSVNIETFEIEMQLISRD